MKVTIERAALVKALGHVQSVVERRNTIPILANVLLHAEGGALTLTATDLDLEMSESAPADVMTPGATTAAALTLYEIVRRLPEGAQVRLDLEQEQGRLQISAGRFRSDLAVLPEADFPTLTADDLGVVYRIPTQDLRRLFEKARFAMSQEETRYYLNGVYLHVFDADGDKRLRAAAPDGHRLARIDTPAPAGADAAPGVIVPRKAVMELGRWYDAAEGPVEDAETGAKYRYGYGAGHVTTRVIDGAFPDYERVIPKDNNNLMRVEIGDFAKAVDRVSTISADRTRSVKFAIDGDRLRLAVNNPDAGSAVEEISVEYKGEPLEIGFNAKYLLDVAGQIDGEMASFHLADPSSPTVIADDDDAHALYVLMPLRV